MGGDDLGSDDEFLNPSVSDTVETSLVEALASEQESQSTLKRKRGGANDSDDEANTSNAKPKKKKSSKHILIEAGRNLQNESVQVQCAFLSTALAHELQLRGIAADDLPKLNVAHFVTSSESTLDLRIKSAVSLKKLKKYKTCKSPMVVVVCVSARRCVAVLKELASLKIRAAKLFAKHMNVKQQAEMLEEQPFGLAVGTPNRLLGLSRDGALNFDGTRLVVLDCEANQKGFTVCTLPDTAADCMELLQSQVVPQFERRKDIRLAMF